MNIITTILKHQIEIGAVKINKLTVLSYVSYYKDNSIQYT